MRGITYGRSVPGTSVYSVTHSIDLRNIFEHIFYVNSSTIPGNSGKSKTKIRAFCS